MIPRRTNRRLPRSAATFHAPVGRRAAAPARSRGLVGAAALALLALASACTPEIQGNGIFREESRSVPAFSGIAADDPIITSITVGPAQSVVVSGDSNVVAQLETQVSTDPARQLPVLELKVTDAFVPIHPLRVDVTVPELRYLHAGDAATVDATGVAADGLEVEGGDGAVVHLAGAGGAALAVSLAGGARGGATLDATDYPVTTAAVALAGGASASLRASGAVTGTAAPGCVVQNLGTGLCQVTDGLGTPVSCAPR